MIMERMCTRYRLSLKLQGTILPNVMKQLHEKSRNLNYKLHKSMPFVGEVTGVNRNLNTWRHTVDLTKHECSCQEWQLTGLPCRHAISFIGSLRGVDLEDYVSPYYSIAMFKATYALTVPPMPDKKMWEKVDTGFKLLPPILKRSAGRPRTRRFIGVEEGGSGKKRRKCKRCHGYGHLQKTCNEPVYHPDAPPPAPPKPKRVRKKKKTTTVHQAVTSSVIAADQEPVQVTSVATDEAPMTSCVDEEAVQLTTSPGPITRSKKALLDTSPPRASPSKANKKKIARKI